MVNGSSPLARGLLIAEMARGSWSGIIPARAGFTPALWGTAWGSRDHPRSRGVYEEELSVDAATRGSSPLARGLRRRRRTRAHGRRIIPARAGFTLPWTVELCCRRDHPRSRGVYTDHDLLPVVADGSSPLARGLPPAAPGVPVHLGIIPARAGFTLKI